MQAHEAIQKAKAYVAELFGEEQATNIGLEELEFDRPGDAWDVTVGFSRPWNIAGGVFAQIVAGSRPEAERTYKVVRVANGDGSLLSIRNRETLMAA